MTEHPPCRGVIIGDLDDPHVRAVFDHCSPCGLVVVNAATLPTLLVRLDVTGTVLRDLDGRPCTLHRDAATRGWIRRLAPEDWDLHTAIGSQAAAVAASRLTLLGAVLRDPSVQWLTGVDALFAAENKVTQLRTAATLGVRIPETMIATDAEALAALGEPFVLKPLGPGHFLDGDGRMQVVHATATTSADLAGVDLADAPFLAQRLIRAHRHVRTVTVAGQAWSCTLSAAGRPIDWRRDRTAHDEFRPDSGLTLLTASALQVADALGCGYTSQDWLIGDGRPVFLDLNPGGQWLFLPSEVSDAVSAAVAAWLTAPA